MTFVRTRSSDLLRLLSVVGIGVAAFTFLDVDLKLEVSLCQSWWRINLSSSCWLTLLPLRETRTIGGSIRLNFCLCDWISFLYRTIMTSSLCFLVDSSRHFMLDQSWTLFALFSLSSVISRCTFICFIKLKLRLFSLEGDFVMNFVLFGTSTTSICWRSKNLLFGDFLHFLYRGGILFHFEISASQ